MEVMPESYSFTSGLQTAIFLSDMQKGKHGEKIPQNPTSNKNETPAPQGQMPDETIIRYIIRAFCCLLYSHGRW